MVIGTTLFRLDGNPYHSPSFPKGNDAATFTAQVTQVANSPTLTITVEHRNHSEVAWMDAGAFAPITAVGLYTVDLGGLKEELRFRYEIAGASPECAVHLFVPAPSWRPE